MDEGRERRKTEGIGREKKQDGRRSQSSQRPATAEL